MMSATAASGHWRRQIPLLQRQPYHYLDNAATALMPAAVLDAVRDYDDRNRGNVGRGVHRFAEAADTVYSDARQTVAAALRAAEQEIIFTAGCTAGLNLLANALGQSLQPGDKVLLSLAEHHSNIVPWQIMAQRRGFTLHFAAPDGSGAGGRQLLTMIERYQPRVISIAHTTNVGGGTVDLALLAAAKPAKTLLVVDGAQYVPHHLPDLPASGADFYVFSGHKCYAPNGIGVLWGRREQLEALPPVIGGGGAIAHVSSDGYGPAALPQRLEPGTPPVSPAVGLAAAMRWCGQLAAAEGAVLGLAQRLREGLRQLPHTHLLFDNAPPSPIVSFIVDGVHAHDICEVLADHEIAVRGGHHCAEPLMVHLGIGGCVRVSLAPYNNDADIDAVLLASEKAVRLLR